MSENNNFDAWKIFKAILIGALIAFVLFIPVIVIYNANQPNTTYKITANNKTYYTNNYKLDNGFMVIDDYYVYRFYTQHFSEPISLQGNIRIEPR